MAKHLSFSLASRASCWGLSITQLQLDSTSHAHISLKHVWYVTEMGVHRCTQEVHTKHLSAWESSNYFTGVHDTVCRKQNWFPFKPRNRSVHRKGFGFGTWLPARGYVIKELYCWTSQIHFTFQHRAGMSTYIIILLWRYYAELPLFLGINAACISPCPSVCSYLYPYTVQYIALPLLDIYAGSNTLIE